MKTRKTKKAAQEIAATRERQVARAIRDLEISIGMSFQLFRKRVSNIFEPGSAPDVPVSPTPTFAEITPPDPMATDMDPRFFENVIAEPHRGRRPGKKEKANKTTNGQHGLLATPTSSLKAQAHAASETNVLTRVAVDIETRSELSPAARRVLEVLIAWNKPASTSLLSIFTGYSLQSGGFASALAELKTKGFAYAVSPGELRTSEAGDLALNHVPPLPRGKTLFDMTANRFDPCSAAIVFFLYAERPRTFAGKHIAEHTRSPAGHPYSATSGGFASSLAKLKKQAIIAGRGGSLGLSPSFLLAIGDAAIGDGE